MSDLVSQSLAKVVVGRASTRNRGEQDDDAIVLGVARVVRREGRVSKKTSTASRCESNGVNVYCIYLLVVSRLIEVRIHTQSISSTSSEGILGSSLLGGSGSDVIKPVRAIMTD